MTSRLEAIACRLEAIAILLQTDVNNQKERQKGQSWLSVCHATRLGRKRWSKMSNEVSLESLVGRCDIRVGRSRWPGV